MAMTLRHQIQHIALRWPVYGYRGVYAETRQRLAGFMFEDLLGTNRMFGQLTASQIASACRMLHLDDQRHGLETTFFATSNPTTLISIAMNPPASTLANC